jgi:PmbA protein
MPSLYGSRKMGLKHVPTAADGWEIAAGDASITDLVGGVTRGALVGRLSMGMPAPNGDFSGVIKNSFAIANGEIGPALLPWLKITNLHFSW